MSEYQHKRYQREEKPAVTAVVRARDMLCELSGQRGWNDTRESWLARGARRAGITLRRARALFYNEPIRLSADEYLEIERAWQASTSALEASADLARDAAALADSTANGAEREGLRDRADSLGRQLAAPDASFRPTR